MGREIKLSSTSKGLEFQTDTIDSYKDKLLKLIPSEIIAAYVSIHGLLKGNAVQNQDTILWIVIGILFLLTPIYLKRFQNVNNNLQIVFTCIAFLIWVFATGSPLKTILGNDPQFMASIALMIYTLFIPLLFNPSSTNS